MRDQAVGIHTLKPMIAVEIQLTWWLNKKTESVRISIPASTARMEQYGASTIFCTATSGRPAPLNHFWCNLQVCCSFLAVWCVAPPYNTLLIMTIWNFLSSLIVSTSSLNSTMNKRLDHIKCRIPLNIFFSVTFQYFWEKKIGQKY